MKRNLPALVTEIDFEHMSLSPIRDLAASLPPAVKNSLPAISPWHGTTIAAFTVDGGKAIVAVSDGKVSEGPVLYPASLEFPKVVEIDKETVMLFAGSAGFAVMYARILKNWVETMERVREEKLNARAKINMLSRILRESLPLAASGFPVGAILATFDRQKGMRIFLFTPDGSNVLRKTYAIFGSGKVTEASLLENWRADMTRQDGVEYAKRLIKTSSDLDSASGGRIFIKVLDENGVESIDGGWAGGRRAD